MSEESDKNINQVVPQTEKMGVLNKKQEMFCRELFLNGWSPKNAYLSVYKGVKPSTAQTESSALLQRPHIQIFIAELQDQLRKAENISKAEIVATLKRTIASCEASGDKGNMLKAIDQLSKIGGLYNDKPTINVQSEGDINISFGGWDPDKATASAQVVDYIEAGDIIDVTPEDGVDPIL